MMTTTVRAIMTPIVETGPIKSNKDEPIVRHTHTGNKICVIGAGSVGTAVAFSLLSQKVTNNIVLIDANAELVRGEAMDMENAMMYVGNPTIIGTTDYEHARDCRICVITAGMWFSMLESRQTLSVKNAMIMKSVIPMINMYCPGAIIIVVTPPVDICSYVAWKLSNFPPERVIGTGTILESARFRQLVAKKLGVATSTCQAYVIGEQGDNSVPVWSGVSTSGVKLKEINQLIGTEEDPENWQELHNQVIDSTYEVNMIKTGSPWGTAWAVTRLARAILEDSKDCFPVSTHVQGCRHGIDKDVFLSLPCIMGASGVEKIVKQSLNEKEKEALQKSANMMHEVQKTLKVWYSG